MGLNVKDKTVVRPLIYIALPYTQGNADSELRYRRYMTATLYAAELWACSLNIHSFSPITQSHMVNKMLGTDGLWEEYEAYDKRMISFCTDVHVLMLPGWSLSEGVASEVAHANTLNIPVTYIQRELLTLTDCLLYSGGHKCI